MLRCLTLALIFCLFTAPAFAVDSWLRYKSAVSPYVLTDNVGIGIRIPTQRLDVDGAVKATTYYGDGSHLTGVVDPALYVTSATAPLYVTSGNVTIDVSGLGGSAAWGSITGTVTAQTDLGIYALDSDLASYVPRVDAAMYVTKGTLTNTKWCVTDGLVVNCTQDAPTGSGLSYGQVQRLIAIGD
jgi:hypothetical protein